MGHNFDYCVITNTFSRHTWGMNGHSMRLSDGKMSVGHVAQLCCAVCYPAQGPSHVGGPRMLAQCEHRAPYLFARHWYPACFHRDSLAQVPPSVIPEQYAPIQVVPGNPSQSRQFKSIRLLHQHSNSVWVDSSLLHIITYYKDHIYL